MTEWAILISNKSENEIFYYYDRLKNRQVDSLSETEMKIGLMTFPVYFQVDEPPKIDDPLKRNFHSMLISTGFPLCPANELMSFYPFEKVEEPVQLDWLPKIEMKGRSNVSYEMVENTRDYTFIAMREKIDGIPFVGVTVHGEHYLVGSHWFSVRFPYEQVEWLEDTNQYKVLYPFISSPLMEGLREFYSNPIVPFSSEKALDYEEGAMIFVAKGDVVTECRIKKVNTVEMLVKDSKIEGQEVFVADGIWECSHDSKWKPLRPRPGKVASNRIVEKINLFPELMALKTTKHRLGDFEYEHSWRYDNGQFVEIYRNEGFVQNKEGRWVYAYKWANRVGEVHNKLFYFNMRTNVNYSLQTKKQVLITSSDVNMCAPVYLMISPCEAMVQGGFKVSEVPTKDNTSGVALLSFCGSDVGVVQEHGKLLTLPGGKIDPGEFVIDALNRELNEELKPGWHEIKAFGPFVSEGCTYFVMHGRQEGLLYIPPASNTVHPYVRRVVEHSQMEEVQPSKWKEVVFYETRKKEIISKLSLEEFLQKPRHISEVITSFGQKWHLKDGAEDCIVLGKEVWLLSKFKKEMLWERRVHNRANSKKMSLISRCLPGTLEQIMRGTGFVEQELTPLLQAMPIDLVSGFYRWREED